MPDVLYAPVLKGKQGELVALSWIEPATREHLLPLLEIVPGNDDEADARPAARSAIQKTVQKLGPWSGQRLLLDVGLLASDTALKDGSGAIDIAITGAVDQGVRATPVLRLDDGQFARREAAAAHADLRTGVAVRLRGDDLDQDSEDIDDALAALLTELGIHPSDLDLVLDLGGVRGEVAVRGCERIAADALRGIRAAEESRTVIVAAGAFPPDLSEIQPWVIGEIPRYDAALFDRLQERRRLPRAPVFGDYAVNNPDFTTGGFRPAPQLRYAMADRWLVLKGTLRDPRGHEQFYDVCETIAAQPDFVGADLGKADARIASPRANGQGPGNASTWRAIGTAHHLDYVVRRLTTLGEP
ncbi:MAG: beta family protein [Streptosporangiaceae bacterium]